MLFMFVCQLYYCYYFRKGTVQVLRSIKGGVQGEILGYNSAQNWFDMVVEKRMFGFKWLTKNCCFARGSILCQ